MTLRLAAIFLLVICLLLLGFVIGYWYGAIIIELLDPHFVPAVWGRVLA